MLNNRPERGQIAMGHPANVSLIQLRSFIAISNEKRFRAAAERLGVSSPALTTRIQELEAACGTPLLVRTTRDVRLTAEGEQFLLHARKIVDDLDAAIYDLRERVTLKRGRIVIAATPSAAANILPSAISSFRLSFPDVQVEVVEKGAADVVHLVEDGRADLGIGPPSDRRRDLAFSSLMQDRFVGIVATRHEMAGLKRIKLRALLNYPLITTVEGTNIRSTLEYAFRQRGLDFDPVHKLVQLQAVIAMVAAGLGITILPALTLPTLNLAKVEVLEVFDPKISRQVGVLQRHGGVPSAAAHGFLVVLRSTTVDALADN